MATDSWGAETDDCCSWVGIECNNKTGNVIGIVLENGCLYGSIDSNSSLFQLVHLQTLILSGNNFNFSKIPAGIGHLSDLRQLDLAGSVFLGPIPLEISRLSKLEILRFSSLNISSDVPDFLANMTSLRNLSLGLCSLTGNFPQEIFHLPNLQELVLPYNPNLFGTFPEFNFNSSLVKIWIEKSSFHGGIPSSIGNLKSLSFLKLGDSNFSGILPVTLGNLTRLQELDLHLNDFTGRIPSSLERLTELSRLFLSYNKFSDASLSWVGKQNKLVFLGLSGIGLSGTLLPSVGNLTNIVQLLMGENGLTGEIPSWIGSFAELTELHLYGNKLSGSIPKSLSQLVNLKHLYLQYNHLNGTVDLSMFLNLKNLTELHLTANHLTVLDDYVVSSPNVSLPKFNFLGFGSCNLTRIPTFLESQNELEVLELGENNIQGKIPKWMWTMSRESLKVLNMSHNGLTGVEESQDALPWVNLYVLDLSNNKLRDSFPILPAICKLSSLVALDLSTNRMRGMLPHCFGNFSSLDVMNFRQNLLGGTIPDTFRNGSMLRFIDFSQNKFQGRVPRSLANCKILEIIDLSDNQLTDGFPFWIGTLPMLRILILRSNHFNGKVEELDTTEFPMLRIVDVSHNNFSGNLPLKYITNSKGMEIFNTTASTYRNTFVTFTFNYVWALEFFYSTKITIKGSQRDYSRIQEVFTSIDLSSNRFEGEIPDIVGNLKGLQSLNISHNKLTGPIPPSMGNMARLESLDLSHNQLSGQIPQQLSWLHFLAIFDVSYNNLSGLIPQGNQFSNVDNSSYVGNVGLCGAPLSKKCGDEDEDVDEDEGSDFNIGWKTVLIGYGCGMLVGIIGGNCILTRKPEWFEKIFKIRIAKKWKPKSGRSEEEGDETEGWMMMDTSHTPESTR